MTTATFPATTTGAMPPLANDDSLYEVINGQRVELPPMSIYASWITGQLVLYLGNYLLEHRLGTVVPEGMFILDAKRDLRRRPDVAFVSSERWPLDRPIPEEGDWPVVPDLAVEVISPNDLFRDVLNKVEEYFAYGVRQVWVVLPTQGKMYLYDSPTQMHILTCAEELTNQALFPGWRLPLKDLFQKRGEEIAT